MVLVDGPAVLPILVPDDTDEAAEIPEATEIPLLPLSEMPPESSSPVRPGPGCWAWGSPPHAHPRALARAPATGAGRFKK